MGDKLTTFINRLKKIGIETTYIGNYPWVYFDTICGKKVKEKFASDYGFVVGYKNEDFTFEDTVKIFKLIRKYV